MEQPRGIALRRRCPSPIRRSGSLCPFNGVSRSRWNYSPVGHDTRCSCPRRQQPFLALTCSWNHSRTVTLPEYRRRVKSRWTEEAPPALDQYLDGAIILEFMHHSFRHTPMINLLSAKADRFDVALRTILGVDEDRLLTQWRAWLATQSQPGTRNADAT